MTQKQSSYSQVLKKMDLSLDRQGLSGKMSVMKCLHKIYSRQRFKKSKKTKGRFVNLLLQREFEDLKKKDFSDTLLIILAIIFFGICLFAFAYASVNISSGVEASVSAPTSIPLPQKEIQIINQIADEYALVGEERTLLFVIRIIENGSTGREFGVLHPQAMRFKDNPKKSFVTQAKWAAGTISKRFNNNLEKFASRWCPVGAENDPTGLNKNWLPNAKYWMAKLQ